MTIRFVALGIDPGVRAEVERVVAPIRARFPERAWTDPAGWHVTLAHLGDLADDRVPEVDVAVRRALERCAGSGSSLPVGLRTGEVDRFGDRVLVVRVLDEPDGSVAALGDAVQVACQTAGLPVTRREVRPHLTVARARRGRPIGDEMVTAAASSRSATSWSPRTVGVWSSHPRQGPARYEVDVEVALPV